MVWKTETSEEQEVGGLSIHFVHAGYKNEDFEPHDLMP